MKTLRFEDEGLFNIRPEDLWPLISDTQRLNRVVGLRAVDFSYTPRQDGGSVVHGEYRRFGVTVARWTEHAYDFERPRRHRVLREYEVGPMVRILGGVEIEPRGDGTIVTVYSEITPRNPWGWALARLFVGPASTSRVLRQCHIFEAYLQGQVEQAFPLLSPQGGVNHRQVDMLVQRLIGQGVDAPIASRLGQHLKTAPDDFVGSMRPFELADAWGTNRRDTLVAFLRATTIGLLDLRWEVLCPNCRIPKAEYSSLSEFSPTAHCETCNIAFDASFDRLIEVRFRAPRAIRQVVSGLYCVGGPQNIPHVVAQGELEAGATVQWNLELGGGAFRVRSPQAASAALIEIREGATTTLSLEVGPDGIRPPAGSVRPGSAAISVTNRVGSQALVSLEEQFWPDTAATAALVSTLQEFRDLFSSDVLAAGLQVGIERLAFLFSDLAGSTALYERVGQATAFRIVQEHFRLLKSTMRSNQGAVVKTIGDAVMAVFPSAADALRAALDAQRRMSSLEASADVDARHLLKVGIHIGPCVAVNLNDRLDYFGTTVNIAARAQHEARGGEIVLTAEARVEPGVADLLARESIEAQEFEVELRGVSAAARLCRVGCYGVAPASDSAAATA